jgi:nucleotidyltransferase/DNA polymerase involved in DNA repair
MNPRIIAHIDMDAFFAAIEQRDNPKLRGKPVVVGADPKAGKGRGVVSTCSYEARKYGIRSAMPISQAWRLCPHAVFLSGNGRKYREASDQVFEILEKFTPDIQPVSIDEAFMDLTGCCHFYGTPHNTALKIKEEIKKNVNLTASIGIAPLKFVAKIASDACKPDGLLEVTQEKLFDFLWPLPIEKLWGVGPKSKLALNGMGINTIGDLAKLSKEELYERFGEHGLHLYCLSNGIDPRGVEVDDEVKSVSNEHTFETDTDNIEEIEEVLLYLSEKVSRRLRKQDLKGRTLSVKIRLKGFKTYTRAVTLPERTNFADRIYKQSLGLAREFTDKKQQIRLLGVRVSNFEDPYVQESLFRDALSEKNENIHKALDLIKNKFGEKSIHRAS